MPLNMPVATSTLELLHNYSCSTYDHIDDLCLLVQPLEDVFILSGHVLGH